MNKVRFMIAVFLPLFTLAVIGLVRAESEIVYNGIEQGSDLYQWLEETVSDKYDTAEEQSNLLAIQHDAERALKSKGYYEATAMATVDENDRKIYVNIEKGRQYTLSNVSIAGIEGTDIELSLRLDAGDVIDAARVLRVQDLIFERVQRQTCAYTLNVSHELRLSEQNATGELLFIVQKGPEARFGEISFEGADEISRDYLRRLVTFETDECWSQRKLEESKSALLSTGLLSVARERIPDAPDAQGRADVRFEVSPRPPRSVRLGMSLYTDEGPGLIAEWQHRNFRGAGERLSARLQTNFIEQSLQTDYIKPFFMDRSDRDLNLSAQLGREETDAYIDRGLRLAAGIDQRFHRFLQGSFGVAVETTSIIDKIDNNSETFFGLVSTPTELTYDNRDSPLNPTRGWWLRLRGEPFFDVLGEASPFLKTSLGASTYFSFDRRGNTILALRGRLGGLLGSGTENVPANKRFYAGGGGSIRGFGYQEAGPQVNGDPVGGRSVVETSVELRRKFNETMGGVVFVDGGGAFDSAYPDFSDGYFVGAGVGFRYYTAFGPIRADIAVPVTKRDQASSAFQLYVSIGQAF